MTKTLAGLLALASLGATCATAGGIDRTALNYNLLFQEGRTFEIGAHSGSPDISGIYAVGPAAGTSSGNMAQRFKGLSFGYKADINDKLSYAILFGQPIAADALYTAGSYTGLEAHWSTEELAALLKYDIGGGTSVFGGVRYLSSRANIIIPSQMLSGSGTYTARAEKDGQIGYVLGAAYEKPDIALRVGLTYTSEVTHGFATTEVHPTLGTMQTVTDITMPQTLTLDAQTGVAPGTLVFGSIRWAEWSKWHVRPAGYAALSGGQEITGFADDVTTFTLGVGRKINDKLSVFGALGYEAATGGVASRLSPTDGMQSVSLGANWTQGAMKITGGVTYQKRGDAVDGSGTQFKGNSVLGLGIKVAYTF